MFRAVKEPKIGKSKEKTYRLFACAIFSLQEHPGNIQGMCFVQKFRPSGCEIGFEATHPFVWHQLAPKILLELVAALWDNTIVYK